MRIDKQNNVNVILHTYLSTRIKYHYQFLFEHQAILYKYFCEIQFTSFKG